MIITVVGLAAIRLELAREQSTVGDVAIMTGSRREVDSVYTGDFAYLAVAMWVDGEPDDIWESTLVDHRLAAIACELRRKEIELELVDKIRAEIESQR